jgi:hypothetical protein
MNVYPAQRDHVAALAQKSIKWLLECGAKFANVYELELFYKYIQEDQVSLEADKAMIEKAIKASRQSNRDT